MLGAVLIGAGTLANVTGAAMAVTYGENMVLDGLPWGVLLFSGITALVTGLVMIGPERGLPSLRAGRAQRGL